MAGYFGKGIVVVDKSVEVVVVLDFVAAGVFVGTVVVAEKVVVVAEKVVVVAVKIVVVVAGKVVVVAGKVVVVAGKVVVVVAVKIVVIGKVVVEADKIVEIDRKVGEVLVGDVAFDLGQVEVLPFVLPHHPHAPLSSLNCLIQLGEVHSHIFHATSRIYIE